MPLGNPAAFFTSVRAGILGPKLSPDEISGSEAIMAAVDGLPLAYVAYALATAYHETASTMQPICEHGGPAYFTRMYDVSGTRQQLCLRNGNINAGDGCKFFGRGYVQLTWRSNYDRAGKKLGIDLCAKPELALDPGHAAKIMRFGMVEGWFTSKRFKDYLPASGPATRAQFTQARRIINGTDCAAKIAEHALKFQAALQAGHWA